MEYRIPGKIVERITIAGKEYTLYTEFPEPSSLAIAPIDAEGTLAKHTAKQVVQKAGVFFRQENFGGYSSGDPPIYRPVFVHPLKKTYQGAPKEEAQAELDEAKQKLIKAVRLYRQGINNIVSKALS